MASAFVAHASRAFTAVRSNPYAFNSVTGFSLFSGSDAIAQKLETENDRLLLQQNESAKNDTGEIDESENDNSKRNAASANQTSENNNSGSLATASVNQDFVGYKPGTMATSSTKILDLSSLDARRLLSAGAIGVLFGGFVYPLAYAKLDALWKGVTIATTLKKSLLEISTVGIAANSVSITTRGLLVGRDTQDVAKHTMKEMPRVTVNDARVWLPYNIVAFSVIPIYIRPATTSLMEACWQTYISMCSHNYNAQQKESSAAAKLAS